MNISDPQTTLERMLYLWTKYHSFFLEGAYVTLLLAFIGTLVGLFLGFILLGMQTPIQSDHSTWPTRMLYRTLKGIAVIYIDVVRGTPMVVQAALFYYGFFSKYSQSVLIAGLIVISLNTSAYLAEILRGGMSALGYHQLEAARSLGLSRVQAMRYVVLPQVVKHSMPAISNEFITNIKDSAVLSIIGLGELFYNARSASSQSYFTFEAYLIVAGIYLLMTMSFTRLVSAITKYVELYTLRKRR